jgi:H+-translocating NAD(P) transhydrogenase subunit beta
MTLPIGGADMPVVISLYNALTGLAVAFEGYVLGNEALIIAGTVVGAAGTLLTQLMAKAMNRSLANVLFGSFGAPGVGGRDRRAQKGSAADDVAAMMAYAERVVIVPGYGMAVAQAQHKIWELAQVLRERGRQGEVRDPSGGRPHAGPHERAAGRGRRALRPDHDMDDINPEFPHTDVVAGHRRQRRGQSGRQDRPGQPDLRHADPGRGRLEEHGARHQARQGHRLRRHRERAVLRRQHAHALGDGAEMANQLVAEVKALGSVPTSGRAVYPSRGPMSHAGCRPPGPVMGRAAIQWRPRPPEACPRCTAEPANPSASSATALPSWSPRARR